MLFAGLVFFLKAGLGLPWRLDLVDAGSFKIFWIYGGIRFLSLWSSEMVLYPIALISCRIRGVYVFDIGLFRYLQDVCSF